MDHLYYHCNCYWGKWGWQFSGFFAFSFLVIFWLAIVRTILFWVSKKDLNSSIFTPWFPLYDFFSTVYTVHEFWLYPLENESSVRQLVISRPISWDQLFLKNTLVKFCLDTANVCLLEEKPSRTVEPPITTKSLQRSLFWLQRTIHTLTIGVTSLERQRLISYAP